MEKEFMEEMLDKALYVLKTSRMEGQPFIPIMVFLDNQVGAIIPMIHTSEEEKRNTFRDLGKILGVKGIHECLVIEDAYFVSGDKTKDGDRMNFIKENWDIEKPSMYPPELRREVLTLTVINFKDVKQETIWMAEYATSGPNVIISGILKDSNSEVFGGIKDSILEGFLVGVATKLDDLSPGGFAAHIDKEYPALQAYLKDHFRR
jgi:hypothetical protein